MIIFIIISIVIVINTYLLEFIQTLTNFVNKLNKQIDDFNIKDTNLLENNQVNELGEKVNR